MVKVTAYGIIERHGGAISVKSEPGKGAVFTMKLPAQPDVIEDE